jgi:hypothetical protein
MFRKLFKSSNQSQSGSDPPAYESSPPKYVHREMGLTFSVNRELESIQSDRKKGKLPAYETEQEHHVRKLMDNYGPGGGMGAAGAMGVPKLPTFAPREKKPKKQK